MMIMMKMMIKMMTMLMMNHVRADLFQRIIIIDTPPDSALVFSLDMYTSFPCHSVFVKHFLQTSKIKTSILLFH